MKRARLRPSSRRRRARRSAPKRLVMLDASRAPMARSRSHGFGGGIGMASRRVIGSASTQRVEFDTAPNTPPCILTILSAARWLPWSVAPQQSSSSRHSKPRSLASRMVVCTQTSVVMPVSTRLSMPRVRRISSRSVAQNEPLPGLSMIGSPAQRRELGDDLPARLAAHQDAAARARIADARRRCAASASACWPADRTGPAGGLRACG